MKKVKRILGLIMVLVLSMSLMACGSNAEQSKQEDQNNQSKDKKEEVEIAVSAAASLQEALDEIAPIVKDKENISVTPNYDASGTLKKQIQEGADVDLFISVGQKEIDELDEGKLIDKDSIKHVLTNDLVLIVSKEDSGKINSIDDVVEKKLKIAIGEPGIVPAGRYAKETFENLKIWDKLQSNMIFTKNVTQVMNYVDQGEVSAGVVYNSDAVRAKSSVKKQTFKSDLHQPIRYTSATVTSSKKKDDVQKYLDFLKTDEAKAIFEKYGFKLYQEQ